MITNVSGNKGGAAGRHLERYRSCRDHVIIIVFRHRAYVHFIVAFERYGTMLDFPVWRHMGRGNSTLCTTYPKSLVSGVRYIIDEASYIRRKPKVYSVIVDYITSEGEDKLRVFLVRQIQPFLIS